MMGWLDRQRGHDDDDYCVHCSFQSTTTRVCKVFKKPRALGQPSQCKLYTVVILEGPVTWTANPSNGPPHVLL